MTFEEALQEMNQEDEMEKSLGPIPKLYISIVLIINFGAWYVFCSLIF